MTPSIPSSPSIPLIPLEKRRIALVGGAGFIGHNLALALAARGAEVSIIDCLAVNNLLTFASGDCERPTRALDLAIVNERMEMLQAAGVPVYIDDARDEPRLSRRLSEIEPQVVVLLAGISHAGRSNADPGGAFEHTLRTVQYTLNCVRGSAEHFIYFSSSMIYGDFRTPSVTEDTVCEPLGIYGALKYAGEKIVRAHHQVFDLPYTIIRPSALYGERCVSRRVVQLFVEAALRGEPLVVHGDGSERLDFTYIDDLVGGIIRVIQSDAARNETFNLSYGDARSIDDLLDLLRAEVPELNVQHQPRRRLTPQRGTLCVDKARSVLGYAPACPLEIGLGRYVQWYRSFGLGAPVHIEPKPARALAS